MQLIPEHLLGWQNAWWFAVIYGFVNIGMLLVLPKERRKRILTFPKFNSVFEKIMSGLSLIILGRGLLVYSIFVPLKIGIGFYIGSVIFLFGLVGGALAMWTFAKADLSKAVTNGLFRVTRHPMQVMTMIMWIGVGIASANWIIIACSILIGFISFPSMKAQERFCVEQYGDEYVQYIEKTSRYLFF